MNIWAKNSRN